MKREMGGSERWQAYPVWRSSINWKDFLCSSHMGATAAWTFWLPSCGKKIHEKGWGLRSETGDFDLVAQSTDFERATIHQQSLAL